MKEGYTVQEGARHDQQGRKHSDAGLNEIMGFIYSKGSGVNQPTISRISYTGQPCIDGRQARVHPARVRKPIFPDHHGPSRGNLGTVTVRYFNVQNYW